MKSQTEFYRYKAAACSLMLMVVIAVGATGYIGIRDASAVSVAASVTPVRFLDREAGLDRMITPAAIALALIAIVLVALATTSSRTAAAQPGPAQIRNRDKRKEDRSYAE